MNIKKLLKEHGAFAAVASVVLLAMFLHKKHAEKETMYSIIELSLVMVEYGYMVNETGQSFEDARTAYLDNLRKQYPEIAERYEKDNNLK